MPKYGFNGKKRQTSDFPDSGTTSIDSGEDTNQTITGSGEKGMSEEADKQSSLIPKWLKTAIVGGGVSGIAFFGITKLVNKWNDNDD